MSARFKKTYCKCGEPVRLNPVYCPHCGEKLRGVADDEDELTTITGAVRDHEATVSPEKRDKKYNQQRWGLFETNYQREKGISTEESLQEIERFQADGVAPTPAPKHKPTVGGKFRQELEGVLDRDDEEEEDDNGTPRRPGGASPKGGVMRRMSQRLSKSFSSGGPASPRGSAAATGPDARRKTAVQEDFDQRMAASGRAGADFFAKFQKKEAGKYKAQYS